jgi:hypothetical protein
MPPHEESLLLSWTQWHCNGCGTDFVSDWPPKCPKCGIKHLDPNWEEERIKAYNIGGTERVSLEEAARQRKIQEEHREGYRRWLERFIEDCQDVLHKAGMPYPEDDRIYAKVHYWWGRPKSLVRFFKHYRYWEPRVEYKLAHKQAVWEMMRDVIRMREQGATYREISKMADLSPERIRQVWQKEMRQRKHPRYKQGYRITSPVEHWFDEKSWLEEFRHKLHVERTRMKVIRMFGQDPDYYSGA